LEKKRLGRKENLFLSLSSFPVVPESLTAESSFGLSLCRLGFGEVEGDGKGLAGVELDVNVLDLDRDQDQSRMIPRLSRMTQRNLGNQNQNCNLILTFHL